MAVTSLYPASPKDVPEGFTAPSPQYKTRALVVLLALALFFLLYFGVMYFCVSYTLWAFLLAPTRFRFLAILLTVPVGILFIYMLKNLFKVERVEKEFRIEVFEDEHPRLFSFIRDVCAELGTPTPTHVYVDYSVNMTAIPDAPSALRLFRRSGHSLLIGLGVVNAINLTEFKAMLAHEFGHFAQQTAAVGAWVSAACRIFNQMVHGQDWFDRSVAAWTRRGFPLNVPGALIFATLWPARKLVELMWYAVAPLLLALRRQEEFHADLFSVALTGSDAPVHLSCRVHFGEACFGQAIADLRVAMTHHLYTRDVFYHQTAAASFIRAKHKDPTFGDPPPLPDDPRDTTVVFEEDDAKVAAMWKTHPSPCERESNAKAHYIRSVFDERSPWLLFDNVGELRERVTYKFYRFYFKIHKNVILAEPEEVQGFIDEEHADCAYDPKCQGGDNCNIDEAFSTYFLKAQHISQAVAGELHGRYDFHLALQEIRHDLQNLERPIQKAIGVLNTLAADPGSDAGHVHGRDFEDLLKVFGDVHKAMKRMLRNSEEIILPALKNLPAGLPVRAFLLENELLEGLSRNGKGPSEHWIGELLDQFTEMKANVDRIHFKSLTGIFALQDMIGAEDNCERGRVSAP